MLLGLLFTDPISFFTILAAILLALSLHEYFHAWAAFFLGDDTAKIAGRLTINPLVHFDFIGLFCLLIFGFGWGRPVPFNPYNLKNQKWGPALIGLAGPFSNFLMVVIFGSLLNVFQIPSSLIDFFLIFIWLNLLWGIFNLVPIPPLDGSHLFFSLFPNLEKYRIFIYQYQFLFIILAVLFMWFLGIPYICEPIFKLITGIPFF